MKNNSLGSKVLLALITLGLAAYFAFQGARYLSDPLTTTMAYRYQVEESPALSGYMVRAERVIAEENGLLQHRRQEGERVSAGGVVAEVYADQAALNTQAEIETLNARIQQLQYAQEAEVGIEVTQQLDQQIRSSILGYRAALTAGNLNDAEKEASELRLQILKRDYTGSGMEDLGAQVEALQAELRTLKSKAAGSVRRITAPEAGCYSTVVDGYETVLTPDKLAELSPAALSAVEADGSVRGAGKLILGDTWYYTAVLPAETAAALQKQETAGHSLVLRFTKSVDRDLAVTIYAVGPEENGKCVVSFAGKTHLSQLTLLRRQSAQVISRSMEGIRVPEEALRVMTKAETAEDGTETETRTIGVYCVVGVEARFKPVEVLYTGEGFALVQPDPPADRENLRLRPGDQVIVAARDLYDGKIVG